MCIESEWMARICFDHLIIWNKSQENRAIEKADTPDDKWPLLKYAIKFWHRHNMELASLCVTPPKQITQVLVWETVKSWIRLWPYAHPWDSPRAESSAIAAPNPAWIAGSYGVPNPVQVVLFIWKAVQLMDGKEDMAGALAVWLTYPDLAKEIERSIINHPPSMSLAWKALPLAPLHIFKILSVEQELLKRNIKAIVTTAINQGVVEIVDHCWPIVELDEAFISDLPWMACVRTGNTRIIRRLTRSWHRFEKAKNTLGPTLLREAVESGQLEVAKLLFESDFDLQFLDDADSYNVISLASQLGFKSMLSLILEKRPNISLQNIHGYNALEAAVVWGYKGIVEILLTHGVPTVMEGQDPGALLHKVSIYQRTEIEELLLKARRERKHNSTEPQHPTAQIQPCFTFF